MEYDDFSKAPESIAELKANKAERASLWTPRDALISALREIDQGKIDPFVAFIALGNRRQESNEDDTYTRYFASGNNAYEVFGVATRALWMMDRRE